LRKRFDTLCTGLMALKSFDWGMFRNRRRTV